MKRASALVLVLILGVTAPRAAAPTITIDASTSAGKVSPLLYGLMTEEINHSYDGGLNAELIRNRAFLDDAASPAHWTAVQGDGATAAIALDKNQPLNATIGTSLRVEVTQASSGHAAGVANAGFWGIPVRPNTRYRASLYAKTAPGVTGAITVAIQSDDGKTTYAGGRVSGLTQTWKQYEVTLSTSNVAATANARFVLTVERSSCDSPAATISKAIRLPIASSGRRRSVRCRSGPATWRRGPIARATVSASTSFCSGPRT